MRFQNRATRWNICRPGDVFFRKPRENIDAIIGSVMERGINGKRQYLEYASSALFANIEPRELLTTKPLIFKEARVRFRHKHLSVGHQLGWPVLANSAHPKLLGYSLNEST